MLGLDPLYCACEGRMLIICSPGSADHILAAVRAVPGGENAARIGTVTKDMPGKVLLRTPIRRPPHPLQTHRHPTPEDMLTVCHAVGLLTDVMQVYLQMTADDKTDIWRTPYSENTPAGWIRTAAWQTDGL